MKKSIKEIFGLVMDVIYFAILIAMIMYIVGCAGLPTHYGSYVKIKTGTHKGKIGTLMGDCSGFENYQVFIMRDRIYRCYRVWDLEEVYYE